MNLLPEFFLAARTIRLPDREIIEALVDPAHARPSPALAGLLRAWPGPHYWSDEADGRRLVLIRYLGPPRAERWGLHAVLAALTLASTLLTGAMLAGNWPYMDLRWWASDERLPATWLAAVGSGWTYAVPLMAILLAHELGHYFAARHYGIDASPPFFIPAPMWPFVIGTLGAFIRLRTPPADRRQLLDVGIAGPIAGFLAALGALTVGFVLSRPIDDPALAGRMVLAAGGDQLVVPGDSLITLALRAIVAPAGLASGLELHPTAFAGWVGMFVTMLNLLPVGQLDGGHILYAADRVRYQRLGLAFWWGLVLLSVVWPGWALWAGVILVLSRGRLVHPSVVDVVRPLPRSRRWLAVAALVLFAITFMPVPAWVQ